MLEDFENMIKNKLNAFKEESVDLTRVPQLYNIKGKQIQELKLLSEGAFGFIWLAEDKNTKQKYALKRIVCMTKSRIDLAQRQLQLMTLFPKSKYLVDCYGGQFVKLRAGTSENPVMIILMEYCPHGNLFDLLEKRQNKGFSEKQIVDIASSISAGLIVIHKTGYAHQDIKIENVLIGENNNFKLCDFGSCSDKVIDFKTINKSGYSYFLSELESITTPMYRPPEIVDPYLEFTVSNKVDIWMLGCVVYTLSYFTHPFVDSNAIGIANGVVRYPKYPEESKYQVSQKMIDFIRILLTPNPEFRPSAEEIFEITSFWHSLDSIPLNNQAKKKKEEDLQKQKELDMLNKKTVQYDGDIPMQKLMQLQNKLKGKGEQTKQTTSFANSKDLKVIKEGKSLASKVTQLKPTHPANNSNQQNAQIQQSAQKSVDINSFWQKPANSNVNPNNQFDSFSFFEKAQPVKSKQNNTINNNNFYELFIETEEKPKKNSSSSKGNEANLLDL